MTFRYTDLRELGEWLEKRNLHTNLQEHPYKAMRGEMAGAGLLEPNFLPDENLLVTGEKGVISVIQCGCSFYYLEMYCIEGDLFEDIERFGSVEKAGKAIVRALNQHKLRWLKRILYMLSGLWRRRGRETDG